MKKTAISILLTTFFATAALAQNIATVNGKVIPDAYEQTLIAEIQKAQPGAPVNANQIKDNLISQEVLAQEAIKLGLDQNADFKIIMELTQRNMLVNALYQDYIKKNPVTDKAITAEYDRMKALMSTEYMARHILVETEAQAKEIIELLNKGAKFAEIASQRSQDKGSAQEGGLLNWAPSSTYVPEFGYALTQLEPGKITQTPVQTQYGWHVIKLEEVRNSNLDAFPPLSDDIKAQIRTQLEQNNFEAYQKELIEKANVQKAPSTSK